MRPDRQSALSLAHVLGLALMAFPGCFYYNSTNVLSQALIAYYGSQNIVSMSYTLYSIPSIFSCFLFSLLIDLAGVRIILPCLQAAVALSSVICALAESRELFLVGKFLYGLAGESVLCAQSKLISIYVSKRHQTWAFGVAMSFYMLGEAVASWVLPAVPEVHECMWVCFALLALECVLGGVYSFLEGRRLRSRDESAERPLLARQGAPGKGASKGRLSTGGLSEEASGSGDTTMLLSSPNEGRAPGGCLGRCRPRAAGEAPCGEKIKEAFVATWRNARKIPPIFWLCLFGRMFYVASKATYDSLSVMTLQDILNVSNDTAVLCTSVQQLISALVFLLSFASGFSPRGPISFLLTGVVLMMLCHSILLAVGLGGIFEGPTWARAIAYSVSVAIGLSFGMFASNASYVIVSLAGKELAASGIGLTYSVQYLIMSGLNPLVNHIGTSVGYVYACFCYLGFLALSLCFLAPVAARVCRGGRGRREEEGEKERLREGEGESTGDEAGRGSLSAEEVVATSESDDTAEGAKGGAKGSAKRSVKESAKKSASEGESG